MKIFKLAYLWLKDRIVRVEVPDHECISASILRVAEEEETGCKRLKKAKAKRRKANGT